MFTIKELNITKAIVVKYDEMCDRIEEIEGRLKKLENINNVNKVHCNEVTGPATLPPVISVPENNRGLIRGEKNSEITPETVNKSSKSQTFPKPSVKLSPSGSSLEKNAQEVSKHIQEVKERERPLYSKVVSESATRSKVKSCYNPLRLATVIFLVSSGIDFVNTPHLYSDRATH